MTLTGHVHGGKVVLDGPVPLPDGTPVRVEAGEPPPPTLAERYADVIGVAEGLPSDFADNHDHYLHGTPKSP